MFIHPDFEKFPDSKVYESILDFLTWERICSFDICDNQISIQEECDQFFNVNLTKEMMEQLIFELQELTNNLK